MKAQTFTEHQKHRIQKQCQKKSIFQCPHSRRWDQKHGLYEGEVVSSQHDWRIQSSALQIFFGGLIGLGMYGYALHAHWGMDFAVGLLFLSSLTLMASLWIWISSHIEFHAKRLSPGLYAKFEQLLNQNTDYATWLMPFVVNTGPIRARAFSLLVWIDQSMKDAKKKDETLYKVVQELHWTMPGEMREKALQRYLKRCIKEVRKRDKNETYRLKQVELDKAWKDLQNAEEKSVFEQQRRIFEDKETLSTLPSAPVLSAHKARL